ncbi:hypothetical protein ACVIHI_008241 [Bradyrhizobium sp. USDA 4524]|uniref:hypothetical protein n=1 Tax=unclassified Bradyrhizobium TaxID=2631580 RepID=UPI0020A1BF1B|nr:MULTISPECIES: hypothetical protein [unclassified Bradyrhizobium]MCP1838838.1 hypothetical protein [Bradyrhizobium sp. USDA 4538]MCP1899405.1 hypothetical protein [Bradyrhizobium sp. USDA 4537]MCP1986484.1 hypothetical protein [Bradyrhizobium sp. USDA 4539]
MKTISLGVLVGALMASSATAAPLAPAAIASTEVAGIEQVRLVCNEYGRCYRTGGPRYVQRYYDEDDGYVVRRSYGYSSGPGYYDPGYGYYGGGPSIGFSFGTRSW